ncbi:hypothetical protein [Nocardia sp. NPDC052112]|uniref:hypothetical protein n=1 Tax=Nocardia sp. NPDC052112 TaxID=3155646 RepID=UPI00343244AC
MAIETCTAPSGSQSATRTVVRRFPNSNSVVTYRFNVRYDTTTPLPSGIDHPPRSDRMFTFNNFATAKPGDPACHGPPATDHVRPCSRTWAPPRTGPNTTTGSATLLLTVVEGMDGGGKTALVRAVVGVIVAWSQFLGWGAAGGERRPASGRGLFPQSWKDIRDMTVGDPPGRHAGFSGFSQLNPY